jgi:hypothetical protein
MSHHYPCNHAFGHGLTEYTVVRHEDSTALLQRPDGKRTVVSWSGCDHDGHQITDAMPGDAPWGGGQWQARFTDGGVDYVASWYSRSYANRTYRRILDGWDN